MYTERFWAKTKPKKSLLHHAIDAGMMCRALLEDSVLVPVNGVFGDGQAYLRPIAIAAASLHDIGKCHPFFQARDGRDEFVQMLNDAELLSLRDAGSIAKYRHESGGRWILSRILTDAPGLSSSVRHALSLIVRLHHQRFSDRQKADCEAPGWCRPFWQNEQDALFKRICGIFSADFHRASECAHMDASMTMIWGLVVLSDWLASGQKAFWDIDESLSDAEYCKRSEMAAKAALTASGLQRTQAIRPTSFPDMFAYLDFTREGMRPLQIACEDMALSWARSGRAPGLILIEAPMGEGKTEAALFLTPALTRAFDKTGFYVALPTAATSNAMHERVQQFLRKNAGGSARLLHAQSWMALMERDAHGSEDSALDAASWLAPTRRGLISQYAVGTVDQAMMSVLRVRYGVLRLLGVASKVLIVDEVHAYDAYMLSIIEELLSWCAALRVPVVLLSATLPALRRERLLRAYLGDAAPLNESLLSQAYPLITAAYPDGGVETRAVEGATMRMRVGVTCVPDPQDWREVALLALERVSGGGCLCVILNTVVEAQETFMALKDALRDCPNPPWTGLFHARFPLEERQAIENRCVSLFGKRDERSERPKRAILIATQVCEQSLDLDFDGMITYLCPIDLLLQRIGRMHRHDRNRPDNMCEPRVTVIVPDADALATCRSAHVYYPWILRMSEQALTRRDLISLPDDIRPLVEEVYAARPNADDTAFDEWARLTFSDEVREQAARSVLLPKPDPARFSLSESANQFMDEDAGWIDPSDDVAGKGDQTATLARTRMGADSLRVALLDDSTFEAAKGNPDRATASKALARSVSISAYAFQGGKPTEGVDVAKGDGMLRGVWLLRMNQGDAHAYSYRGKRASLRCDTDLGLVREEESAPARG